MQREVNEFMEYVKGELARGLDDWEQRLNTALVKSSPTDLVRADPPRRRADDERNVARCTDAAISCVLRPSDPYHACAICDDTGWKPVEHRRRAPRRALRLLARHARTEAARRAPDIPSATSTARSPTSSRTTSRSSGRPPRRAASPRRFRSSTKGLFLDGQPGVGKTHLAVAVLRQVDRDDAARAGSSTTRATCCASSASTYDPSTRTTEIDVLRPVMTADLLVLDDLGAEKTSEWVEETMNLIVNTRYNERRLTIFTSNYEDIPDDTDPNSLLFRIGFRMRSRLHEMCEFLELDGADYRELPTNGGVDDLLTMWKMRTQGAARRRAAAAARRARSCASPPCATAAPT